MTTSIKTVREISENNFSLCKINLLILNVIKLQGPVQIMVTNLKFYSAMFVLKMMHQWRSQTGIAGGAYAYYGKIKGGKT